MHKFRKKLSFTGLLLVLITVSSIISNDVISQNYNSEEVSSWETIDCFDISLQGDYAYLSSSDGLLIVDIREPEKPQLISMIELENGTYGVDVEGDFVYIAADNLGLLIANIRDPFNPTIINYFQIEDDIALKVIIHDSYAFVNFLLSGIFILEISNPHIPVLVGHYTTSFGRDMKVHDDLLFLCTPVDGLSIIDISDRSNPDLICFAPDSKEAYDAFITDNFLYLARFDRGISIYDVSNPNAPILTDSYNNNDGGTATGIFEKDGLLYVADGYSIELYNVSNPYNIVQVIDHRDLDIVYTQDIAIDDDNVFVVQNGGLYIMKFTIMNQVIVSPNLTFVLPSIGTAVGISVILLFTLRLRNKRKKMNEKWPLVFRPRII